MKTIELRERAYVSIIEYRLRILNKNHFSTDINIENPKIDNLIEDYMLFQVANPEIESDRKTILCSIKTN